jgi:hypothetical protein
VVTKVGLNFVTDIHLNMAGVDGVGQTSGSLYIGTGSNKLVDVIVQPQPPPNRVQASFTLETTNGCASVPLLLTFELVFGTDGALLPQSTVSVGGVT